MSETSADAPSREAASLLWVVVLFLGPLLLIPLGMAMGWLDPRAAASTLGACLVAAAGGLLSGVAAERLLHRGTNSTQHLLGMAVTSVIGLLTIGYLYLVRLRGPMDTIDTPPRIISQVATFVTFLTTQAAGVLLSIRW